MPTVGCLLVKMGICLGGLSEKGDKRLLMYPLAKRLVTKMNGLAFFGNSLGMLYLNLQRCIAENDSSEPGLHGCGPRLY